jgi:hypothetical protein
MTNERKQALKKLKEDKVLKAKLRAEIAIFLIDLRRMITCDPIGEWIQLLSTGFKGYHNLRNKELISLFEQAYRDLYDESKQIVFYTANESKYGYYGDMRGMGEEESLEQRREVAEKAEQLMLRLFEESVLL